jgi:hypothetical protein
MPNLPAVFSEAEMIDEVAKMVGVVRNKMTVAASREWLEAGLYALLQQGLAGKLRVVEAADAGDDLAHGVLMKVDAELSELGQESATLKAYRIKVQTVGRPKRGRGHPISWHNNWRRDIGIACLVSLASIRFGVTPTSNREQRRAHQITGSSLVAAAWGPPRLSVQTTQNIYLKYVDHLGAFFRTARIAVPD